MNNKLSKTLIKHCNECFLALKRLINRLQNFWKLHIFWDFLHKLWYNNFKNFIKIKKNWIFFLKLKKKISPKAVFKVGMCGLCYPISTLIMHSTTIVFDIRIMHNVKIHTCPIHYKKSRLFQLVLVTVF
jgi:hypothetical protein